MAFGLKKLRRRFERTYLESCGFGSGHEFMAQLVSSVGYGDVVFDIGCGEGKLRFELNPGVTYIGLDRYAGDQGAEYENWEMRPTIMGDARNLPLASSTCKTVALMHVLEHVRVPIQVLSEIERVLEPGGYLFMDVPFMHEIHHSPHDHFRFTPNALISLAETTKLEVIEIRPSGGYFRALAHILEAAPKITRSKTVCGTIVRVVVAYPLRGLGWLIRKLQYLLDLQDSTQTFTCGYHCVFRKPSSDS